MKKTQQGFTLIELMIVVAIIGILAAIAIPAYQDYLGRSQASEAPALLSGLKAPIAEYYSINGAVPTIGNLTGAVTDGNYVASIALSGDGVYTATYVATNINAKLKSATLIMTYASDTGKFTWDCTGITDAAVRPSMC